MFKERIRNLDKKVHHGLTKIKWSSKGISDLFISECRLNASKVQKQVDDYKVASGDVEHVCKTMSKLLLVQIDPRKAYANFEFEEDQVISTAKLY